MLRKRSQLGDHGLRNMNRSVSLFGCGYGGPMHDPVPEDNEVFIDPSRRRQGELSTEL